MVEKAAALGAHTISGAIMDPRGLNELLPGWQREVLGREAYGNMIPVTRDRLWFLTKVRRAPPARFSCACRVCLQRRAHSGPCVGSNPACHRHSAAAALTARPLLSFYVPQRWKVALPVPPSLDNHGNVVGSLSGLVRWLGAKAEGLGVEIFTGEAWCISQVSSLACRDR